MPNKTLNDLDPASTLDGSELMLVEQSGSSRKLTLSELSVLLNGETAAQKRIDSHMGARRTIYGGSLQDGPSNCNLVLDGLSYDTDGFFNDSIPTRFTIPPGVTKVRLGVNWVMNDTGKIFKTCIAKNGETFPGQAYAMVPAIESGETITLWSPVLTVTAGDFFEFLTDNPVAVAVSQAGSFAAIEVVEVQA